MGGFGLAGTAPGDLRSRGHDIERTEWKGWRINPCHQEPSDEWVLQMTNIAPWGEEARAVRMVCKRAAP